MYKVFLLAHEHYIERGSKSHKEIGIYSSKSKAEEAVRRLSTLPGFRKSANILTGDAILTESGFIIIEFELDVTSCQYTT